MMILVIGGEKHGKWVETLDGVQAWVDIVSATTYRIRKLTWGITAMDPATFEMRVTDSFVLRLAIHPAIAGRPDEPGIVQEMVRMIAMNEFIRAHGEKQEVKKEPPGLLRTPGDID